MINKIPTPEEVLQRETAKVVAITQFPQEEISEGFKETLHKAMMYTSQYRLGCHDLTYEAFIKFNRPFFMVEMQLALNIIKGATPIELNQTLEENLEILQKVHKPMFAKWKEIEDGIKEPIIAKINKQIEVQSKAPKGKSTFKAN